MVRYCTECNTQNSVEICPHCKVTTFEWIIHCVNTGSEESPINAHTHGLFANYGHLDLQICLPLPSPEIKSILNNLGSKIKDGQKFKHGEKSDQIIKYFEVAFYEALDIDRKVLRIVFPDKKGNLEIAKMEQDFYVKQYKGVSFQVVG